MRSNIRARCLPADRLIVAGSNGALINIDPDDRQSSRARPLSARRNQHVAGRRQFDTLRLRRQRPAARLPLEPHRGSARRQALGYRPPMPLPTVAIIGRPNVGKSTLFNRLVGKRLALVDDRPGVTRDRREGEAQLLGLEFRVIDTAGLRGRGPADAARPDARSRPKPRCARRTPRCS